MIAHKRKAPVTNEPKLNHIDAVLCADLHIRADVPLCRTDDFQSAMFKKLDFIFDLCRFYSVPLLCGGDIGHRAQWPNWLIERFMAMAEGVKIISALGQHDLPGHNLGELPRSACGVLNRAGVVDFEVGHAAKMDICFSHFGQDLPSDLDNDSIFLTHRMVIEGNQDWPGQIADKAHGLLSQLPFCQLILSGDNHQPFAVQSKDGRWLVNPGSMMRSTAIQADHRPRVYLWDAVASQVRPVYLPIEEGVIDRNHIDIAAQRDERLQKFTERLKMDYTEGLDYADDIREYLKHNRTNLKIKQKVLQACELGVL